MEKEKEIITPFGVKQAIRNELGFSRTAIAMALKGGPCNTVSPTTRKNIRKLAIKMGGMER